MIADAEFLSAGRAGGNLDAHFASQGGHGDFRAQRGLPRREFEFVNQVMPIHVEIGMLGETDAQVKVAIFAAAAAAFAAAGRRSFWPSVMPGGNLDLMRFGAVAVA